MHHTTHQKKYKKNNRGIAIFVAVVAVSALMLIALALSDIANKGQIISYSGRDSKVAFYAADAGMECALFYDLKGGLDGTFAFATSSTGITTPNISCVVDSEGSGDPLPPKWITPATEATTTHAAITTFYFDLDPLTGADARSCAIVRVTKVLSGTSSISTKIDSRGYNATCTGSQADPSPVDNIRNLERSFRVNY